MKGRCLVSMESERADGEGEGGGGDLPKVPAPHESARPSRSAPAYQSVSNISLTCDGLCKVKMAVRSSSVFVCLLAALTLVLLPSDDGLHTESQPEEQSTPMHSLPSASLPALRPLVRSLLCSAAASTSSASSSHRPPPFLKQPAQPRTRRSISYRPPAHPQPLPSRRRSDNTSTASSSGSSGTGDLSDMGVGGCAFPSWANPTAWEVLHLPVGASCREVKDACESMCSDCASQSPSRWTTWRSEDLEGDARPCARLGRGGQTTRSIGRVQLSY